MRPAFLWWGGGVVPRMRLRLIRATRYLESHPDRVVEEGTTVHRRLLHHRAQDPAHRICCMEFVRPL